MNQSLYAVFSANRRNENIIYRCDLVDYGRPFLSCLSLIEYLETMTEPANSLRKANINLGGGGGGGGRGH